LSNPVEVVGPELALERHTDPVEQWLRWEEQANLVGFRVSTEPVEVSVAAVPRESVVVELSPDVPQGVVPRFVRDRHVLFPRHPLNRDPSVAFFAEPEVERWHARFTSSRTLVVPVAPGEALFSMKLPTDHPHPDFVQPEKTHLRHEALDAIHAAALIHRVDAALGPDPTLAIVREAVTVLVPETEYGFVVRDLRPLQDGHHHLPALSIPWVGRQIARLHGQPFEAFWGRHYAAAVGRAKAKLLARYGLQYETPNPQNIMVRLDAELRPTGTIVMRDLGDTDSVMVELSAGDRPWDPRIPMDWDVCPETRTSFWAFDGANALSVPEKTLERWYALHDAAYHHELQHFFALPPEASAGGAPLAGLDAWIQSDAGRRHVARAWERHT
jgi:hypothetical protein